MADGVAQGLVAKDDPRKPQCPSYWTRGAQQDNRPHQKSILVGWYVEHRGRICAILSSLLVGEIRPQDESGCFATNATTREEMSKDHNKLGDRFVRVWRENCNPCICGSSLKDGSLCFMYKRDINREICLVLH